jgi:catechol 2,3-dioxygenase-like lactoylglutathione lyase family enzyme
MAAIDHVILKVNDLPASVAFYVDVLGFAHAGQDGPFTVIRVADDFVLQLAPYGTEGNEHLAFAMGGEEFRRAFARIRELGIPYGDAFNRVGTNAGPGRETGARGPGPTVYLFDPNRHLIEIRTYEE